MLISSIVVLGSGVIERELAWIIAGDTSKATWLYAAVLSCSSTWNTILTDCTIAGTLVLMLVLLDSAVFLIMWMVSKVSGPVVFIGAAMYSNRRSYKITINNDDPTTSVIIHVADLSH